MVVISMLQRTLADITKLAIVIEENMLIRKKSTTKYHQDFDSEELGDFDEEKKWRPKKKKTKDHFETIKRGVYCQNCYNEGHLIKKCKLLNKFCQICKQNDHNID